MDALDLRKWQGLKESLGVQSDPFIIDDVAIDSRRVSSKNTLFIALSGLHFDGHAFVKQAFKSGAKAAIIKKGVAVDVPFGKTVIEVENPLRSLQQIAAIYRQEMRSKIIAITGSYGKTMLKDLLEHLISEHSTVFASPESFNSQLGVALSLFKIQKEHNFAVIEAGISQKDEMIHHVDTIQPDHVIVTNIGSAHIASLNSRQSIASEKMKLLSKVPLNNWCLIPSDDLIIPFLPKRAQCYMWDRYYPNLPHVIPIQKNTGTALGYEVVFPNGSKAQARVPEGHAYTLDLITIAVKAAQLLGISPIQVSAALSKYQPEPMRIELWRSQQGATIINDTYCADPMSCDMAMKQFESINEGSSRDTGKKIFLFGGLRHGFKNTDTETMRIAHAIAKHSINLCIMPKQHGIAQLVANISLISPQTEVVVTPSHKEAIAYAKEQICQGDAIVVKGPRKLRVSDLIEAFDESLPNNQVIINLAAIQSNIEMIRASLPPSMRIMVMVKALAYGTDDVRISKFLKSLDIDILGVSYVDEGVTMRSSGVTQNIFVLNATEYEAAKAVKWDLEIGVSEPSLIDALQKFAFLQGKIVKVHLHVDTGMSRFGCKREQALLLAKKIHSYQNLSLEGIMTHFSSAENPHEDAFTLEQARTLESVVSELKEAGIKANWIHACNSSATIRFGFSQFNMIRIGLAAYGLHTSSATKALLELKPAISLVSRIVGINECVKGDSISYGRGFTIDKDKARIAVLPIGYFDGLHRNYSGKASVMIRGKHAPMVGKICMDYMMVDISDNTSAEIGDPVLIFGEDEVGHYLSPEELAGKGGSIVHELMTCLGPRIRRLFIYDEALRPR